MIKVDVGLEPKYQIKMTYRQGAGMPLKTVGPIEISEEEYRAITTQED